MEHISPTVTRLCVDMHGALIPVGSSGDREHGNNALKNAVTNNFLSLGCCHTDTTNTYKASTATNAAAA